MVMVLQEELVKAETRMMITTTTKTITKRMQMMTTIMTMMMTTTTTATIMMLFLLTQTLETLEDGLAEAVGSIRGRLDQVLNQATSLADVIHTSSFCEQVVIALALNIALR